MLPPPLCGLGLGERVIANDQAPVEDAEQPARRADSIRQQGVGFVLITEGEAVATIGEATVRPGDVIDGFRVVKIDTTGVYLTDEGATEP
jgi:hypothetical protein